MLYGHIREHKANHRFELQCIQCYWSRSNVAALYAECIGLSNTARVSSIFGLRCNAIKLVFIWWFLCHTNTINVNEVLQRIFFCIYRKFAKAPKWNIRLALSVFFSKFFLLCKKKMVAILTYPMIVYKWNSIGIMCNRCGCFPF